MLVIVQVLVFFLVLVLKLQLESLLVPSLLLVKRTLVGKIFFFFFSFTTVDSGKEVAAQATLIQKNCKFKNKVTRLLLVLGKTRSRCLLFSLVKRSKIARATCSKHSHTIQSFVKSMDFFFFFHVHQSTSINV